MSFHQTRIYQQAIKMIKLSKKIADAFPPGYGFLSDQLKRASFSILQNFSEGYGKGTLKEQRRYFRIAKASANECYAIIDGGHAVEIVTDELHQQGIDLADHLAAMLTTFRR